ncbi:PREDICTED: pulmonary surfactant-associated protein C-like [Crocodylus porosus]|uniref:pulmonary surfactant-associated protein C-like n=1 Tax=Crocodylus porosus TaxID=8502 RepID=UPI000939EC21|nr:PREDICTED: pulmonary surfactant-associated protein C-like [Crocodylus porosus]XP_019401464.1 PREDICTED: pulmonary surfactant-associated protein C-like [Crocodylus porosus]
MTAKALEGEGPWLAKAWEEEAVTFHLDAGANNPATAVYDYSKLLIGYRSWLGQACYVTRMDKDNIQGVDAITKAFQYHQGAGQDEGFPMTQADRSTLGTTINILCSHLPIYWA